MCEKIEDWENDNFVDDNDVDLPIDTRLDYIRKFKDDWTDISIYEYYNGIQVSLNKDSISKDVLLACDGDEMTSIEKELAKIIIQMSKLNSIYFGSRFPSEIVPIFDCSPVKKIYVQDDSCIRFIKSYEGVEFLEVTCIIFEDEQELNLPFIPSLKEFIIDDLEIDGDENILNFQIKKAFPNAQVKIQTKN